MQINKMSNFPPLGYISDINFKLMDVIIRGQLDKNNKCPVIEITFLPHQKSFLAIIDTGSTPSHIRPDVREALGLGEPDTTLKGDHPIHGKIESPVYDLRFKFNDHKLSFVQPFMIMNGGYQFPVILGSLFLSRCKAFYYNGPENRFELTIETL
jgi:hypothetical protein